MPDEMSEGVSESVDTGADSAAEVDFDLDAAVEEFATSAPDEWKGKASKIQSELKNLRAKYTPYRDRFEALHENDREAINGFVDLVKSGDRDASTKWLLDAAKSLSGESWDEVVAGLTPQQREDLAEAQAEEAAEGPDLSTPEGIQKMIQDAIQADRNEREQQTATAERQAKINSDFQALGYDITRNKEGRLTDFTTQQVAMLAINDHGGDINKAHEAYQKWLGDQAKAYLQKHQGDKSLVTSGEVVRSGAEDTSKLTAAQKAQARIQRLLDGPTS